MAKIKDIAEKTGFSITTISRVLNQDKSFNVSDETRLTIMTAAEELNYKPLSQRGKASKKKKGLTVGLIYWYSVAEELTDPYYLSIRLAIENYCNGHDFNLKKIYLPDKTIPELKEMALHGVIAVGKYSPQEIQGLKSISPHLILVDCYTKDYEIDVVKADLVEATEEALTYLAEIGIANVGYIGGVESTLDGEILKDGRMQAFLSHGKDKEENIHLGSFTADSGYELMTGIIQAGCLQSAYLVGSDAMAIGVLKALNEHRINVPKDVSVVSFDNIALSQYTIPALTTIDMNTTIMGETAAQLLGERLATGRTVAKKVFIPTRLIRRDSTF
ncbi:MAG: LacI family DNA-binding transcriptional regulator [Turicibacter sp.]|nr:LacI family DNA-binding transcriptional regulator [Turicibacter sp.]